MFHVSNFWEFFFRVGDSITNFPVVESFSEYLVHLSTPPSIFEIELGPPKGVFGYEMHQRRVRVGKVEQLLKLRRSKLA